MSAIAITLMLIYMLPARALANPVFAPRIDTAVGDVETNPDLIQVGGDPCAKLAPAVTKVVCGKLAPKETKAGCAKRTKCYLKLFKKETSCNSGLKQRRGNAGNPHAAYGLCSLEASPNIRRANRRGPDCVNIGSVENQIKCCRAIMRKTPHYFGPVNRGVVPKCG